MEEGHEVVAAAAGVSGSHRHHRSILRPLRSAFDIACARSLPPLETERTLNADMSRAVRPDPQSGHSADGSAARTSSSKRGSHS